MDYYAPNKMGDIFHIQCQSPLCELPLFIVESAVSIKSMRLKASAIVIYILEIIDYFVPVSYVSCVSLQTGYCVLNCGASVVCGILLMLDQQRREHWIFKL